MSFEQSSLPYRSVKKARAETVAVLELEVVLDVVVASEVSLLATFKMASRQAVAARLQTERPLLFRFFDHQP